MQISFSFTGFCVLIVLSAAFCAVTADISIAQGVAPWLRSRLSPRFLPFLAQSTLFILSREFEKLISIPDIRQKVDVPVVGEIQLELNQTRIDGMHVHRWDRALLLPSDLSENTLLLKAEDISIDASSRWRWWKGILHSHGTVNVSVINCSVTAWVHLIQNGSRIAVNISNVETKLGDLQITISESRWTWLYSLVKNILGGQIKNVAENQLRAQLLTTIPGELNKLLRTIPLSVPIWRDVAVNLDVMRLNVDAKLGLELDTGGRVFLNHGNVDSPSVNRALCPYDVRSKFLGIGVNNLNEFQEAKMLWLEVDEPLLNCMLFMLNVDGFFKRRVPISTGNTVLSKSYLDISLLSPPKISFTSDGVINAHAQNISLKFKLFENLNQTATFGLLLNMHLSFELRVAEQEKYLIFQGVQEPQKSREWKVKSLHFDVADIEGDHSRLFELYPLGIQSLSHEVQKTKEFLNNFASNVPVPVELPWPLSKIRIGDIDMDVLDRKWRVQVDFILDEPVPSS